MQVNMATASRVNELKGDINKLLEEFRRTTKCEVACLKVEIGGTAPDEETHSVKVSDGAYSFELDLRSGIGDERVIKNAEKPL